MLPDLPVRTGKGEIMRVSDLRNEKRVVSAKNCGFYKGKELEQSRIVYRKNCLFCTSNFEGIATAKYCSNSCRQKAKRARSSSGDTVL